MSPLDCPQSSTKESPQSSIKEKQSPVINNTEAKPSSNQLLHINFAQIAEIEQLRQSKVIVLATSMLDMEFLPELYDMLLTIGHSKRLDVVLYGRGGQVNAARKIALLLHKFTDQLTFIVPHHCQSACTILALSGAQIIASDMAIFSPIDPRLNADSSSSSEAPSAMASEDIRLFCRMSEDWFDLKGEQIRGELLSALAASIFPTTLTSVYRSTLETKDIALQMLALQGSSISEQQREQIASKLLSGYHSHSYAIEALELKALGLNIHQDCQIERLAWSIATQIRQTLGGGVRKTPMDPRIDVMLATASEITLRQRYPQTIAPSWVRLTNSAEPKQ